MQALTPLVDDDAIDIDVVIRRPDQSFTTVQIKARSKSCAAGDGALFAAIPHELRDNYWFVFYSERMDKTWIMSSEEFLKESNRNKTGKNIGSNSIWFNGKRTDKATGKINEHCKPQFEKYLATDFSRLITPGVPAKRLDAVP